MRPNPQFNTTVDGTEIAPKGGYWQPLQGTFVEPGISYLHERDHKRELRLRSAQQGTHIASDQHDDLKRTLEFTLRTAFVQALEAKTVVKLAQDDLAYYEKIITISRDRFKAGDLAQIDLDRIELLRVQYEAGLQTAIVDLRTVKIQLLQLPNHWTPVAQFDVSGPFDFPETLQPIRAIQYSELRPIQLPQLQNDLAAERFPVPLAHIGGLHTAGIRKPGNCASRSLESECTLAILRKSPHRRC